MELLALASGGSNVVSTMLNNKAQKDMNQINFDNQVKLWKMQNEYNKPENQMKRLQEAGLNPNLVYGGGATTTAGPVGYTPGVASQSPLGGISDAVNNYMNYAGQREERLLRKQAIENAKEKDNAMTDIAKTEAGIKKEQLKEAKLNNFITRQRGLQDMDINRTTEIRNQESYDAKKPYQGYNQSMIGRMTGDVMDVLTKAGRGLKGLSTGIYNYFRRK